MNTKVAITITAVISGSIGFAAGWFIKQYQDDKVFKKIAKETPTPNIVIQKQEKKEETINDVVSRYRGLQVNPPKKVVLTEEDMHPVDSHEDNPTGDDKPYLISVEMYEDENDGNWDKAEYVYYGVRNTLNPNGFLADDIAQTKVMDPIYDIGEKAWGILQMVEEGANYILYVRNPSLHCDIMVTVSWDEPDYERYDMPSLDYDGGVKG